MTAHVRMQIAAAAATVVVGAIMLAGAGAQAPAAPPGGYTRAQATRGQFVYIQECLSCHGAHLEGISGPPLQGPNFGRSMTTGKMSTPALYKFIKGSMPMNAPGSLTPQQYLDVLAYILNANGYAPGTQPLSAGSLAHVPLLPYPNLAPNPAVASTPGTVAGAAWPAAAKVDVDDAFLRSAESDANDWPLPGRTYGNWRYSPLTQIDTANVASLVPVTIVHTGIFESFETTPIVVDGIMYLTTPVADRPHEDHGARRGDRQGAVDDAAIRSAASRFAAGPTTAARRSATATSTCSRSTTSSSRSTRAPDTSAGRVRVADPSVGYSESMAPQIFDGMVIVGSAGGEWTLRGFVAAYDARTGTQRWRWYSTDPKTFAGNSWKGGGGTVWTSPAIDPARGLLIFGTGNPNPDLDGSTRAGINLYTDSIVALDVHTGKLRWYYQEVKHDLWDYDATSNVVLFDVHVNGAHDSRGRSSR